LAISKERKQELVTAYKQLLQDYPSFVLTAYSGMTVKELETLRGRIRETGGEFHIIKNKLADRVFKEADVSIPVGALTGPTAIGFAEEDIIEIMKVIVDVAKESEALRIKGALIDGEIYDEAQSQRIADLPPLPVLRAQLVGLIQSPAIQLAGIFAGSVRQVAGVLKAYAERDAATA
jgi:large subunit ribosomal protein L10